MSRGFGVIDPAKQREIASKGGKAAHAKGTAHKFTSEEARAAGRKGAEALKAKYGSEHFQRIGKLGGASKNARPA